MADDLADRPWLPPAGRAGAVFVRRPEPRLTALRDAVAAEPSARLVVHTAVGVPDLATLLEDFLRVFAEAARQAWPDWYGGVFASPAREGAVEARLRRKQAVERLAATRPGVSTPWLRQAIGECTEGRLPLVPGLDRGLQLRQLATAVAAGVRLAWVVSADAAPPDAPRRAALARGADWAAAQSQAPVLLLLPEAWRGAPEWDFLSADPDDVGELDADVSATDFHEGGRRPEGGTERVRPGGGAEGSAADSATDGVEDQEGGSRAVRRAVRRASDGEEERFDGVWPIRGRPHPQSPGEQRLAERLAEDAELRGLFEFNVDVEVDVGVSTSNGQVKAKAKAKVKTLLVDLWWREGRLVVEVDGYGVHGSEAAFERDRERDFLLSVARCRVLRLPHRLVMTDPEEALERIRRLVRLDRPASAAPHPPPPDRRESQ